MAAGKTALNLDAWGLGVIMRYLLHEADVTGPQVRPATHGKAVYGYPANLQPPEFKGDRNGIIRIYFLLVHFIHTSGIAFGKVYSSGR